MSAALRLQPAPTPPPNDRLTSAPGAPEQEAQPAGCTAVVVSEGGWLAVSTEGFSEQQRGRPLAHLVKELVQNALDGVGSVGRIELELRPTGPGRISVRCRDDGPGAEDLAALNVVFLTGKKDGVTRRGRMGRGFKEILSVATSAAVRSRDQELLFTGEGATRRVVLHRGLPWHAGFAVDMEVEHDEAHVALEPYFRSLLPPEGVHLEVNGEFVPPRPVHHSVDARLTTERFANGRWEKPSLATRVDLVRTAEGEEAAIHEMGIPVAPVGWDQPYHCDVRQRVPMNPNRDAVMTGYAAKLRRACLPVLAPEMDRDGALQAWVGEAVEGVDAAVQEQVAKKAFGEGAVRAVPAAGRFDYDADAAEFGHDVVHTAHMPPGFRGLAQRHVETSAAAAKRGHRARAAAATARGLTRDEVLALDPDAPAEGLEEAARAIAGHGREAVLARMDFSAWFCEAIVERRHGVARPVPVQVACLDPSWDATWSAGDELTLNLAAPRDWSGPLRADDFALLVHETAHREALHHGAAFAKRVEAYAGAAAAVMLDRADEVRRRFPSLAGGARAEIVFEAPGGAPADGAWTACHAPSPPPPDAGTPAPWPAATDRGTDGSATPPRAAPGRKRSWPVRRLLDLLGGAGRRRLRRAPPSGPAEDRPPRDGDA